MKIKEAVKGCRYWGYEPASAEYLHSPMPRAEKDALRDKNKAERETIKAAELRPSNMGYSKSAAIMTAERIEKATGIEMMVFSHDYM